jgi:hypothetical protein
MKYKSTRKYKKKRNAKRRLRKKGRRIKLLRKRCISKYNRTAKG